MMVSTGPSEYMCRREGGKDTDKGQRQEKENSIQENKEITQIFIIEQRGKKPFGCFVFVKDIPVNRQNVLSFLIYIYFFKGKINQPSSQFKVY